MMTKVYSLAHYLPPEKEVVGLRRPIADDPVGPSGLVLGPTRDALSRAGLQEADLELILFATMTPDVTFPGSACFLHQQLACGTIGALDIRAQCAGFLFGLLIADGFIRAGKYEKILLAAAEVHSSGLDYSESGKQVAQLFGDGAGAAMVGRNTDGAGLEAIACHSDGRLFERFWCEYPASRHHPVRIEAEQFRAGRHFPSIDFDFVAGFGRERLPAVIQEVVEQAAVSTDNVDVFIVSHVLPEVVESSAKALGIPASKLIDAGCRHGHLSAAALPVALSEAITEGKVGTGARVCLAACGAGFAWGAALLSL